MFIRALEFFLKFFQEILGIIQKNIMTFVFDEEVKTDGEATTEAPATEEATTEAPATEEKTPEAPATE